MQGTDREGASYQLAPGLSHGAERSPQVPASPSPGHFRFLFLHHSRTHHFDRAAQGFPAEDAERLQEQEHGLVRVLPAADEQPHLHMPVAGCSTQRIINDRPEPGGQPEKTRSGDRTPHIQQPPTHSPPNAPTLGHSLTTAQPPSPSPQAMVPQLPTLWVRAPQLLSPLPNEPSP